MSDKPTEQERERAAWALLQAQIRLANQQGQWSAPRALAVIALALAAAFAAGVFAQRWAKPQTITVHVEGPIPVVIQHQ